MKATAKTMRYEQPKSTACFYKRGIMEKHRWWHKNLIKKKGTPCTQLTYLRLS